jgi:hypothetical protein
MIAAIFRRRNASRFTSLTQDGSCTRGRNIHQSYNDWWSESDDFNDARCIRLGRAGEVIKPERFGDANDRASTPNGSTNTNEVTRPQRSLMRRPGASLFSGLAPGNQPDDNPITRMTRSTPVQTPALKISPIASQPVRARVEKVKVRRGTKSVSSAFSGCGWYA